MGHLKRQKVPKSWPIARKGTKFVVKPSFNLGEGVPLLILVRDMLKAAQNRREVKKAIHTKQILINGKIAKDDKQSVVLFDIITFVATNTNYKLTLSEKGKFKFEEVKDAKMKITKIIDKKILKGKKIQLNLMDGRNYLSDLKCNVNDSIEINLEKNKVGKCLVLKEKAKVLVFAGKHAGTKGIIKKLEGCMAELDINKKNVNVLIKQLMVVA